MPSTEIAALNKSVVQVDWGKHATNSGAFAQILEHHMGIGTYRMELATGHLYCSDAACRIYGFAPTRQPIPLQDVIGMLIREDRRRGADLLTRAIEKKCGYRYVLRIKTPEGETKAIESFADVELNAAGEVVAVMGTVRDISERLLQDSQSTGRSLMVRALLINIPAAIAILDRKLCYIAVSEYWAAGHGVKSARELVGRSHYAEHPDLPDSVRREHLQVLEGTTLRRPRAFLKSKSGQPIHQTCVMSPWYTIDKHVGGMIIMLGTVDPQNTPSQEKSATPLPTRQEFLDLLSNL